MTGGVVVVLGPVGRNACAGMTGGTAYFLAEERPAWLDGHGTVTDAGVDEDACAGLLALLRRHADRTGSALATAISADPRGLAGRFVRVRSVAPATPATVPGSSTVRASVARA